MKTPTTIKAIIYYPGEEPIKVLPVTTEEPEEYAKYLRRTYSTAAAIEITEVDPFGEEIRPQSMEQHAPSREAAPTEEQTAEQGEEQPKKPPGFGSAF